MVFFFFFLFNNPLQKQVRQQNLSGRRIKQSVCLPSAKRWAILIGLNRGRYLVSLIHFWEQGLVNYINNFFSSKKKKKKSTWKYITHSTYNWA